MIADYSKEIRSQHAHCNGMSYIGIILVQIQVGEPNKLEPPDNNHLEMFPSWTEERIFPMK